MFFANYSRHNLFLDTKKWKRKEYFRILEFNYTNNYFPHLRFNGTSFEVRNEEDLKNLLYGIEQRFYTTVATYEKRCASAVYSLE